MQYMKVQGKQYPVVGQVNRNNGDIVPVLDIKMMSDEELQKCAAEQAIKNFCKWYGRDPVSAEEAFEGQRAWIAQGMLDLDIL